MPITATLAKDPARSLIIRGLAHDYKRVLRTLTVKVEEIISEADSQKEIEISRPSERFLDSVDALAGLLDVISNRLNEEDAQPVTAVVSKHTSQISQITNDLTKTAELIAWLSERTKYNLPLLSNELYRHSKRVHGQISELLLMPFNEIKLNPRSINIKSEINRVVSDIYSVFHMHGASNEEILEIDVSSTIKTDRTMFVIALSNIITNAIVHNGRAGQMRLHITELDPPDRENAITISVSDNGPGIPEEDRERIFLLFEQGSKNTSYRGSGVGLTFAKFAMRQIGGEVRLKSKLGEGANFLLDFPNPPAGAEV